MPARIFIRVDLPAPFSPISACTVPRFSRNETSSSATTPGNSLRIPSALSRYSAFGIAPLARTAAMVDGLTAISFPPGTSSKEKTDAGHPASVTVGSSVLLDEILDVFRRHKLEGDVDLLVHLLALGERERRTHGPLALAGRILEHGDLEVAGLHRGKSVLGGIDAADDDLVQVLAGSLQCLDRADGHFVVVGNDGIEFDPG